MDNEMIEKISKAAYEKFNENLIGCCEEPWGALPVGFKTRIMCAQAVAIKAMRKPTEKMLASIKYADSTVEVWENMIDAIIGDE